MALTGSDPARSQVQLVRCSGCGTSRWLLDGVAVDKQVALGALSAVFAPAQPAPRPARARQRSTPRPNTPRPASPRPAATPPSAQPQARTDAEIAQLLAGWQVLGGSS